MQNSTRRGKKAGDGDRRRECPGRQTITVAKTSAEQQKMLREEEGEEARGRFPEKEAIEWKEERSG